MMKDTCWQIKYNKQISSVIFEMKLATDDFSAWREFVPGQFVHIRIPNAPQLLLRRPISVHMVFPSEKAIVIQYAVIGEGTAALSRLKPEEEIIALGPIGRGFPIQNQRNVWLLGGGVGIAPLFSIVRAMPDANYTAFFGWKCKDAVYSLDRWRRAMPVNVFTDDGTLGIPGFALDGMLQQMKMKQPDVVFACGPKPMLTALAKNWDFDIPCYVSLEERMACGVGACLVCNCKIKTNAGIAHRRVCVDGPVFPLQEVDFS